MTTIKGGEESVVEFRKRKKNEFTKAAAQRVQIEKMLERYLNKKYSHEKNWREIINCERTICAPDDDDTLLTLSMTSVARTKYLISIPQRRQSLFAYIAVKQKKDQRQRHNHFRVEISPDNGSPGTMYLAEKLINALEFFVQSPTTQQPQIEDSEATTVTSGDSV